MKLARLWFQKEHSGKLILHGVCAYDDHVNILFELDQKLYENQHIFQLYSLNYQASKNDKELFQIVYRQ